MLTELYLSVYVVTGPLLVWAQPSGTEKCTWVPRAVWSTKTASSGMSPGGLNSVAAGADGVLELATADGVFDGLAGAVADELTDELGAGAVGAVDVGLLEPEPQPARPTAATTARSEPAATVTGEVGRMPSTLGNRPPALGQRQVSVRPECQRGAQAAPEW